MDEAALFARFSSLTRFRSFSFFRETRNPEIVDVDFNARSFAQELHERLHQQSAPTPRETGARARKSGTCKMSRTHSFHLTVEF